MGGRITYTNEIDDRFPDYDLSKLSLGKIDIDDLEWKAYVTKCTTGEWPVPPGFVSDKNNWLCRAIVGRVLYFIKDVEGALTVLSTFINDIEPDLADHPGFLGIASDLI